MATEAKMEPPANAFNPARVKAESRVIPARIAWALVAAARRHPGILITVLLAGTVLVLEVSSLVAFVVDDSYITFAFSKNLARGHGPVYGEGMVVEGYSNFLWMVLVALPLSVFRNVDPVALARVMELPFVALLFGATYALARRSTSFWWAAAAALYLAVDQDVVLAFLCGLETLPYTALVTTGFLLYTASRDQPTLARFVTPVFAGAALTRIDGFIPLGFIIAFEAARAWVDGRLSLRRWAVWAAPGVAIWAIWFLWRYAYYGLPLPSTYYAKALIPDLLPQRGRNYVLDELAANGLWLALPAAGVLLWRRKRDAVPLLLFGVAQPAYAAQVGGDWMPFARFLLPGLPILVVLIVWALAEVRDIAAHKGQVARTAAGLVGAAAGLWLTWRAESHVSPVARVREKLALAAEQVQHVAALKDAARYLARAVPKGARLVTDYGGVLAYYTESTPIEMWGLCNAMIARRGSTQGINPIYGKTCPVCYPELKPEYFHVAMPIVRRIDAFSSHAAVVRSVWQTDAIGRYIDIVGGFASGRVVDRYRRKAVWFLQKREPGWSANPRVLSDTFAVEYPFETGGLLPK